MNVSVIASVYISLNKLTIYYLHPHHLSTSKYSIATAQFFSSLLTLFAVNPITKIKPEPTKNYTEVGTLSSLYATHKYPLFTFKFPL